MACGCNDDNFNVNCSSEFTRVIQRTGARHPGYPSQTRHIRSLQ